MFCLCLDVTRRGGFCPAPIRVTEGPCVMPPRPEIVLREDAEAQLIPPGLLCRSPRKDALLGDGSVNIQCSSVSEESEPWMEGC